LKTEGVQASGSQIINQRRQIINAVWLPVFNATILVHILHQQLKKKNMTSNSNSANAPKSQENVSEVLNTLATKRPVIPIAFALIIIFFFFGFVDFKCNGVKVASLTGLNLVAGTHVKTAADNFANDNYLNSIDNSRINTEQNQGEKVEPNLWAILALLVALGGLAAFYKKIQKESLAGTAAGAIGFVSLLILKSSIKNKISEQSGGMVSIEIDFLFGYWASLISFFLAGGLSYLRLKKEKLIESEKEQVQPISKPITPLHVNIITQDTSSKH
jgi:hypothetical protein